MLGVTLLFWLAARLGFVFNDNGYLTPVWPPAAVACVAGILYGPRCLHRRGRLHRLRLRRRQLARLDARPLGLRRAAGHAGLGARWCAGRRGAPASPAASTPCAPCMVMMAPRRAVRLRQRRRRHAGLLRPGRHQALHRLRLVRLLDAVDDRRRLRLPDLHAGAAVVGALDRRALPPGARRVPPAGLRRAPARAARAAPGRRARAGASRLAPAAA